MCPTNEAELSVDRAGSRRRWARWLPVLVVGCGLGAYHNCFDGVFLLDDAQNIVENPTIRELTPFWELLSHRRRPVVSVTLAVNYALGELETRGYHAFNLAVHLLAGLALYGVVHRTLLTRRMRGRFGRSASWFALAVSLLWVVHPLTTQSVTYIIQRSESLMGLFYLLTLYCVIRASESSRGFWWYAGAVMACALGMGSKAVMVTAPVTVLIYDAVFLSGAAGQALRRRWLLYVGLAATWGVLVAQGVVRGVLAPAPGVTALVGFGYGGVTPWAYLLTQAEVILHYIRLSVWPHPLCLDYGWPTAKGLSDVGLPHVVILVLLAGTWWALARRWWVGFAGAWFFVVLAPTSSFIPIKDVAFEHRMYLPLAGVVALVVGCVHGLVTLAFGRPRRSLAREFVAVGLVVSSTVALGLTTVRRNRDYHDAVGMWRDVVARRPRHVRGQYNLATMLFRKEQYRESAEHCRIALALRPNHVGAHQNLGTCLQMMGQLEKAAAEFERVVELDPDHWRGRHSLGTTLARLGRFEEAAVHLEAAVRINPQHAVGFYNLGNVYRDLRRLDQAIDAYGRAIEIDPGYVSAYHNRAVVLRFQGRLQEAVADFEAALRIDPDREDIRTGLETTRAALSRSGSE